MRTWKRRLPAALAANASHCGLRVVICAVAAAIGLAGAQARAQCDTYALAPGSAMFIPGVTDVGNHADDASTEVALPFPVWFYGAMYSSVHAGSNGYIDFTTPHAAGFFGNACLPTTAAFGPVLLPHWDDLRTDAAGSGIFTDVIGAAPNRTFVIEWRATYYTGGAAVNFEVQFHEDSSGIDIVYGTVTNGGVSATVGCQYAGTGPSTQFECNTAATLASGLAVRLNCASLTPAACCASDGTCTLVVQTSCQSPSSFNGGGSCTPNPCPQPPSNDDCANAQVIASVPYAGTVLATPSNDDLDVACNATANVAVRNGVWYRYTTGPDAGRLTLGETGPNDTVKAVFTGADCSGLTEIACFDAEANNIVDATANTTYWILVGMWSSTTVPTGTYNLTLNFTPVTGACCASSGCTLTTITACTGSWLGAGTSCAVPQHANTGLAMAIPEYPDGGPASPVTSQITIPPTDTTVVTSLQVVVGINHAWGGDLRITLTGPNGSTIDLFNRPGTTACAPGALGNGNDLVGTYTFSDSAAANINAALIAGPSPLASGPYRPSTCGGVDTSLNGTFGGVPLTGTWTLTVSDEDEGVTGTVESFGLAVNGGYSPCPGSCCTGQVCTTVNSQADCIAAGGSGYVSAGTCTTNPCSGVGATGACCAGGTCSLTTSAACTGANTGYSGDGTVCNAAGNFTSPCCKADFNHVGGITIQDIFDFLNAYFTNNPLGDVNQNGSVTIQDIFDFLNVYFNGCT